MATKSYLTANELIEAESHLLPPNRKPDGDERKLEDFGSIDFSKWLADKLLTRFKEHPKWEEAGPVAIGSWARGELAPKSDIDLIFSGPEDAVMQVVHHFSKLGMKLRYRVPQDPNDWTVGVEPFDVLALLSAVPLSHSSELKLREQREKLKAREKLFRRSLIRAMVKERKARAERFDSISNYLEPNLKFGPGGLRDLEQALVTRELFPERFSRAEHAFDVLRYYKKFFLLVRQKLHLGEGATEILAAPEQRGLAEWLGFEESRDFMREIQKGISRVSFYADWVVAQATESTTRLAQVETRKLKTVAHLFDALQDDPSILMQNRVRLAADAIFRRKASHDQLIGRKLSQIIDPSSAEKPVVALVRARLIDHCVPEFRRIVGHVQHDQYHRFTVDAHILQALRELKRLYKRPKIAGKLSSIVRMLKARNWKILAFSCLYHDIAKGRKGDHSVEGTEVAQRDLRRFGFDASFIKEVCWIVQEHLALSAAAFRENPHSPRTWKTLADKGVRKGQRLQLLAIFTIVDIRATNPEAWTPWKERLLAELITQLEKPEADAILKLADAFKGATKSKEKWPEKWPEKWIETLDPFLIHSVPPRRIVEDFKALMTGLVANEHTDKHSTVDAGISNGDLSPDVIRVHGGKQTWVRFHSRQDRPGLFLRFVRILSLSGLSVRHASIYTDSEIGVYDWFEVKSSKPISHVRKLLAAAEKTVSLNETSVTGKRHNVSFDSVELVSCDDSEWVISFKGKDQPGALVEAARALFEEAAQIRWAKVHTWGRQIDDVFGVSPTSCALGDGSAVEQNAKNLVLRLEARLNSHNSITKV